MRKLKWIKLFEAFKSERITKVLDFINKDSKEEFISEIKEIFNYLDIPMSEVSDDFFEYLPYKKALNRVDLEDTSGDIQFIKFWFDKDGKYITKSGTDGSISNKKNIQVVNNTYGGEFRKDLDLIPHLSNIKIFYGSRLGQEENIGIFFKNTGEYYFISNQQRLDGGQPSYNDDWRKFGRYSWSLTGGDFDTIETIDGLGTDDEITYNHLIRTKEDGSLLLSGVNNKLIDKAHFSIILDVRNIKDTYNKIGTSLSGMISKRKSDKEGALSLMSDEEFKEINIKRYIDKIITSIDISNIIDIKRVIKLVYYNKKMFYWSILDKGSNIRTIIEYYKSIVIESDPDKNEENLIMFNDFIKHKLVNYKGRNDNLVYNLEKIKSVLKNDKSSNSITSEKSKMYYDIFIKIEEIAYNFYKNFNDIDNIETIYDLLTIENKLDGVYKMFERFNLSISFSTLTSIKREEINMDYIFSYSEILVFKQRVNIDIDGCKEILKLLNDIEKVITKF